MSAEWVTAAGTVGTFIVIAASAIAALMQLRHMRSGNEISLLTAYNTEFDTLEFQLAFDYVRSKLPVRLQDEAALAELAQAPPFLGEYSAIRTIANFFEDMGAFVVTKLLDKHIVCTLYAENAMSAWQSIAPVVALLRHKNQTPAVWENFEYLAAISSQFLKQHPDGTYPASAHRMPSDERLVELWKRQQGVHYVA